ncbi:xanthine dehydrogenase family protein molybdopterin-binding subunit [Candidatus Poriferisocius sp.]|uniref:xanthine dehydrogenase family protein molybdopterin-binding subunit n=1 Tax=Candidatus Poriferisocius sp. TaxID=3101276 RepID=UPI003B58CC8A
MAARLTGQSVDRVEGPRLLRGEGRFTGNIRHPDLLHVAFARSQLGHADITGLDTAAAEATPGVVAVFTAEHLEGVVAPITIAGPPELAVTPFTVLATDRVRTVGEPLAVVVARTRQAAADGAAAVEVDYRPRPAVATMAEALADGAPLLFDDLGTNVVYETAQSWGADIDDTFARADHVFTRTFHQHRFGHAPLEGRVMVASYSPADGTLLIDSATKRPHAVKLNLANLLGIAFGNIRVRAGDIGGAFGSKGQMGREDIATAAAAVLVGGTVQWTEDRTENLQMAGHAREEDLTVEVAVTGDGTLLGIRADMTMDQGAYPMPPYPSTLFCNLVKMLIPNAYRLEAYAFSGRVVATNKASYIAYRGPWAAETWVRERMLDEIAAELSVDRVEIRRRNLIHQDQPTRMITGPTVSGITARQTLDRAAEIMDLDGFAARQAAARAHGRLLGLGFATFIEIAPGPPDFAQSAGFDLRGELASARLEPTGELTVASSQSPHGQGHETTIAQVAADELGVGLDRVRVVFSDTDATPFTVLGTGGSRSSMMGAGSARAATARIKEKVLAIAAEALEANPADLEIADGTIAVRGTPGRSVPLTAVAQQAWFAPSSLPEGMDQSMEVTVEYRTPPGGWASATHCCWVDIDAETGEIGIDRYVVVEDCGEMIHPAIVDGQILGGVAQGIAAVLYERHHYDDHANLLTSTLADYLVPSAAEIPVIEVEHLHAEPLHDADWRGVGEGGLIGAPAAITNAVADAVRHLGIDITEQHLPPKRMRELLSAAGH